MKKSKSFLSLSLLIAGLFSMTGCAKSVSATYYGVDKVRSDDGIMICKIDTTVNNGNITSNTIEETYTPNVWARIAEADKDKVPTVTVDVDGTPRYYAKYIEIDGTTWIGSDGTETYGYLNEYVCYAKEGAGSDDASSDLIRYLEVSDAGTYKLGANAGWYYNAVMEDKIKILNATVTTTGEGDKASSVTTYSDSTLKPTFPTSGKKKSANTAYASWKSAIDALNAFFVKLQKIDYIDRVTDFNFDNHDTITLASDGATWQYNQQLASLAKHNFATEEDDKLVEEAEKNGPQKIDGCKNPDVNQVTLDCYFYGVNQAFASVEYESIA